MGIHNRTGNNRKSIKALRKKGKRKRRVIITTLIALVIIFITFLIIQSMLVSSAYMKMITTANMAMGIFDEEEEKGRGGNKVKRINSYTDTEQTVFGVYPVDSELRIRQEMLEICEKVGEAYGISGKLVLAVAMTEAFGSVTGTPKVETVNGELGSLYTHLSLDNMVGAGGRSFFKDVGNSGKYKDSKGSSITELYKIGNVNTSVGGAVGMLQFEASWINGNFKSMYTEKDGAVTPRVGVSIMSIFDEVRGFLRPNPLFFPDQAVNAANKITSSMRSHQNQLSDVRQSLPNNISQEILFIYATDAYRGDLTGKGKNGKSMHDAMGNMYADVYARYSTKEPNIKSLGDFSKSEFNKTAIRSLAVGKQSGNEFSGKLDGEVSIGGNKYNKTFMQEFSNTKPHNLNYYGSFNAIKNGGRSMNKFGVAHGFEGLNAATYYWQYWMNLIDAADKEEVGIGQEGVGEGSFTWPIPGYKNITSQYGMRIHPILKVRRLHTGMDISAEKGAAIVAAKSGTVSFSGWQNANGKTVVIEHENGQSTLYAHQSSIGVDKGDKVKAGQQIGEVGTTGWSTGPHLHFEIRINGNAMNPLDYIAVP